MGFWTYEICPGRWVRQWHVGSTSNTHTNAKPNEKTNSRAHADRADTPVGSVRVLGTLHSEFSWRADWAYYLNASRELARHDAQAGASGDSIFGSSSSAATLGILRPEGAATADADADSNADADTNAESAFSSHSPALDLPSEVLYQYHSQLYANGTRCDPSGRQFETILRVRTSLVFFYKTVYR